MIARDAFMTAAGARDSVSALGVSVAIGSVAVRSIVEAPLRRRRLLRRGNLGPGQPAVTRGPRSQYRARMLSN